MSVEIPAAARPGSILGIGPSLRRVRPIILPIATVAAALLLWQLAAVRLHIPTVLLPTPSEIALRDVARVSTPDGSSGADCPRYAAGVRGGCGSRHWARDRDYLFAADTRHALSQSGVSSSWCRKSRWRRSLSSGSAIGSPARVAFATFISFFPVVISAAVGFAGTDPAVLRLCRSLTASEWRSFLLVRFPFALPAIFSGLKVAMTMAVVGVIIGEFISSQAGLGHYIMNAGSRLETADVFAALGALSVLGIVLYGAVALAEFGVRRVYGRR